MTYHSLGWDEDMDPEEFSEMVDRANGPELEAEKWERLDGWYDDREAEARNQQKAGSADISRSDQS